MTDHHSSQPDEGHGHSGIPLWLFIIAILFSFVGGAAVSGLLLIRKQATKITVQTAHAVGYGAEQFLVQIGHAWPIDNRDLPGLTYSPGANLLVERGQEAMFTMEPGRSAILRHLMPKSSFQLHFKGDPASTTNPLTIITY